MTTAHCYTESEKEQIREMVRTGKIHSSYLSFIELPSPPKAHIAHQDRHVMRSPVTHVLIVMLLGLSVMAASHFSQSARANTIEQIAIADSTMVTSKEKHDAKLVNLVSALVAHVKDQESRIIVLESAHKDESSMELMQTAATRVVTKKAYIRTGPSKTSSPLMAISAGTRLVQIGLSGEWAQVYAPSGEVGWVSQQVSDSEKP